jgi:hypothetical protein
MQIPFAQIREHSVYFPWVMPSILMTPFSREISQWIQGLNIGETADELLSSGMSLERIKYFMASSLFVKEAVQQGFSLFEIWVMVKPPEFDSGTSVLQNMILQAEHKTRRQGDDAFLVMYKSILRKEIQKRAMEIAQPGSGMSKPAFTEFRKLIGAESLI